ncbi:MAG: hypothetical protein ABI813_02630 [Bacteroidota bacterium]
MDHIFYLNLENDIGSARVRAIDHPFHQLYHVKFEDGYENTFFTDAETGNWVEEDLGETALAAIFGIKTGMIKGLSAVPCKPLTWCKAAIASKIISFGFHTCMDDGDTIFEVYGANRKFLYSFRNSGNNRWVVYDTHQLIKVDQYTELVKIIISIFRRLADCI